MLYINLETNNKYSLQINENNTNEYKLENISNSTDIITCDSEYLNKNFRQEPENIIEKIQVYYPRLSAKKQRVATYVLNNPSVVAVTICSVMAEEIGTHETTFMRFCTDLGFEGFPDFQEEIQRYVNYTYSISDRYFSLYSMFGNKKSLNAEEDVIYNTKDILAKTLDNNSNIMRKYKDYILSEENIDSFNKAIESINNTKLPNRVWILSDMSCYAMSASLNQYLNILKGNSNIISLMNGNSEFGHDGNLDKLNSITKDDLVLVLCGARVESNVINWIQIVKDNLNRQGEEVNIISITENKNIVDLSRYSIHIKTDFIPFMSPIVVYANVVEAVVNCVALSDVEDSKDRVKIIEGLWNRYGVFSESINGNK